MPKPTEISEMFVKEMNAHLATGEKGKDYRGFGVMGGRSYDRIVNVETAYNSTTERPHSVHAFIDRVTGDLIKSGGWKTPQKNSDGTLAVRYHMSDENEVKEVVAQADRYGSYLYK